MFGKITVAAILIGLSIVGAPRHNDDKKPILPADTLPEIVDLQFIPGGFSELPPTPENNRLTLAKVRLGRKLFFDPILSADGTVSCASCHQPEYGFASPDALAIGIDGKVGKRNSPSLLNRSYGTHFFWDGRSESLEKQALDPISNPDELGDDPAKVLAAIRANKDYAVAFQAAFGNDSTDHPSPTIETLITMENLGKAIASFERTLLSGNSGVDRFHRAEYTALSQKARQGMWIFESRGGCWQCHSGPNFSDEKFHNTGVGFTDPDRDTGRLQFTEDEEDRHKFKTPSLRDVDLTAPYMHDGSVKTLKEAVEFYNKGGAPDDPGIDKKLKPLKLTDDEVEFLVEFLKAMTGEKR